MSALKILYDDIEAHGVAPSEDDWRTLCASFEAVAVPAGDVILCQSQIADRWVFVARGVAASAQSMADGEAWIARFFEAGHFAANLPSAWRRDYDGDDLVAVTPVDGVFIPDAVFREAYLRGGAFTGKAHSWHERRLIEDAIWNAPGVVEVEDKMKIG